MLRNLRTLVAWHAAAAAAYSLFNRTPRAPHFQLVELADHSDEAIDDIKKNGRAIIDSLKSEIATTYADQRESLSHRIETLCKIPSPEEKPRPLRAHADGAAEDRKSVV